MLNKWIKSSLNAPALIIALLVAIASLGVYKYQKMPVDAFPDISPVMVPIFAEGHGMAPEEIERLITYPIESAMNGLPKVKQIKSTSAFGMAVIYVYFEDNVDIYFARQLVAERLASASSELPEMDTPPSLGPISTGLGQIFMYYLSADSSIVDTEGKELNTWLRELNDWVVKFQLQTVPGVTDVLSMGGHILQYQIELDPFKLRTYGVTLEEVVESITGNNRNVGGQFLVLGSEEHLVRGLGLLEQLEDLASIPVKSVDGTPVYLSNLGKVQFGNEIRRGVVTLDGQKEVVAGIVMKLYGENTSEVIERLYSKIEKVKKALPKGVHLEPYYEQAELIENATSTVKNALWQGGLLVILVLAFFLGNWRSALIVTISLPICALTAVTFMDFQQISANLMSLGGIAIAIGMLGDGAIVMVENIFRHLEEKKSLEENKSHIIYEAAKEVANPIFFSILIIILVFIPLLTLEGTEGKMFAPMAYTISFALIGSLFFALFGVPALSKFILQQKAHKPNRFLQTIENRYRFLLEKALNKRKVVLTSAVIALLVSFVSLKTLGTEFIPTLEEGSIQVGVNMAPSISLEKATETVLHMEKKIKKLSVVKETVSRIGRPEAGSHPHPVNTAEIHVELEPSSTWEKYDSKEEIIEDIRSTLETIPGIQFYFTQPIQNLFDELLSGVKTQLAIKVFGEDLKELRNIASNIQTSIEGVEGLVDLSIEQSFGQPQVQVEVDRKASAKYGIPATEILEMVELAVGGEVMDQIYLNTRRFGIHIRYSEEFRGTPEAIENLLISTEDGSVIPLGQVAKVKKVIGPIQINREKNQRRWIVQANVKGRDIGSVVAEIQEIVDQKVKTPPGYTIEYGGQFENQQRAMGRLMIIVPLVILGIFLLLWFSFSSFKQATIIIVNIPLALVGGVFGLIVMGEYLSVPASVGFIALFGIAVQNGMVLVSYFNYLKQKNLPIQEVVMTGATMRLRPVIMTAMTTILGLFPLLISSGAGSEVQRPLASVVVFGLATSTLLTLFVIPIVFSWVEERKN